MFILKPQLLVGAIFLVGLAKTSELNDAFKGRNVNKTIARVEAILAKNPSLPRLTRGEILALFENITKADAAKTKQQGPLKSAVPAQPQPEKEKSIMVVLPYSANSTQDQDLEELYTRSPITRIVGVDYTTPTTTTSTTTSTTTTTVRPKRPKKRKNGTRRKPPNQEIRPVYISELAQTASPSTESAHWKPIQNPEGKPTSQNNSPGFEVPEYMQGTLDAFRNSNNQVFVTLPPQQLTSKPPKPKKAPNQSSTPVPNISIAAESLTPELKQLLVSLGLLNPDGSQTNVATTTTTTHAPPPLIQYISINPTVDPTSYIVFKPLPLNSRGNHRGNNDEELSDDMREFLARFGLTTDTDSFRSQKALSSGTDKLSSTTSTTTSTEPTSTSTTTNPSPNNVTSNATEEERDELKVDLGLPNVNTDAFTDDMKDVLANMGLMKMPRKKSKGVIFNPAMRTAGLLNQSAEKEKVSKLLTSIKQLSEAEKNKSLSAEEVAEQLQNITASLNNENTDEEDNLELVEGEGSENSYEGYEPAEEELLKLQNGFIDDDLKDDFPLETFESDTNNSNNNHLNSDILPDLTSLDDKKNTSDQSLRNSFNPPDPLSPEELNHFLVNNKNEVKRQQPNKRQQPDSSTEASSETTTSEASVFDLNFDEPKSSSSSASPPTDDSSSSDSSPTADDSSSSDSTPTADGESTSDADDSSPSQDDLFDSFGGDTPPRPNGLYFLVDWNTFLRVGTDNRTVDLNFSPKVGDPKNFLPITVP